MNTPLLFSLLMAICPVNVSDISAKNCEMIYHSGGYRAEECTQAKGRLIARLTRKGVTQVRLIICEEESPQQLLD